MKPDICEAGLSDHHKMVYSFLRKTFAKGKPKSIYYRCFKNFEHRKFNEELKKRISIDISFEAFLEIFQSTWDRFAPYKHKKLRYYNNPFMTKQLRKEIMVRSKVRNEFNKSRKSENWKKIQTSKKQMSLHFNRN